MLKKESFLNLALGNEKFEDSISQTISNFKKNIKNKISKQNFITSLNYKYSSIKKEIIFPKIKINYFPIQEIPISYIYRIEIEFENLEKIIIEKRYSDLYNFFLLLKFHLPFIILPSFPKKINLKNYSINYLNMNFLPDKEKIKNRGDLLILFFQKLFSNSILKNSNIIEILHVIKHESNFNFFKILETKSKKIFKKYWKNSESNYFIYFDKYWKKINDIEKFLKFFCKKLKNEIKLIDKKKNIVKNFKLLNILDNNNFKEKKKNKEFLILLTYLIEDIKLIKEIVIRYLNIIDFRNFEKKNIFIFKGNRDLNDSFIQKSFYSEEIKIKIILLKNQLKICLKNIEEDIKIILKDYTSKYTK